MTPKKPKKNKHGRTMRGITITKDFEPWDKEFQRLCDTLHFDPAKVIRELMISWVKKAQAKEGSIQELF